jgi:hypothetical protein
VSVPDHLDAFGVEDRVEGVSDLRAGVVYQEAERCSTPTSMTRLGACGVTYRESGFDVEAIYSIRRVARELKDKNVNPLGSPTPRRAAGIVI